MCVSRKIITSYPPQLSTGGAKRDAREALPAVGRLWPSDDNGDNDEHNEIARYKMHDELRGWQALNTRRVWPLNVYWS